MQKLVSVCLYKQQFYESILKFLVEEEKYENAAELLKVIKKIDPEEVIEIEGLIAIEEEDDDEDE